MGKCSQGEEKGQAAAGPLFPAESVQGGVGPGQSARRPEPRRGGGACGGGRSRGAGRAAEQAATATPACGRHGHPVFIPGNPGSAVLSGTVRVSWGPQPCGCAQASLCCHLSPGLCLVSRGLPGQAMDGRRQRRIPAQRRFHVPPSRAHRCPWGWGPRVCCSLSTPGLHRLGWGPKCGPGTSLQPSMLPACLPGTWDPPETGALAAGGPGPRSV